MPKDINWNKAKELLIQDIAGGFIPETMTALDVMEMRAEYRICLADNFKRNFNTLRANLKRKAQTALMDDDHLWNDCALHPVAMINQRTLQPRWCGSEAETHLKKDISDNLHLNLKPRDFYMTRQAFQAFPLKTFRNHYYQEIYSRKGKSYWLNYKKNRTGGHP